MLTTSLHSSKQAEHLRSSLAAMLLVEERLDLVGEWFLVGSHRIDLPV
jgi:hypothetical protein